MARMHLLPATATALLVLLAGTVQSGRHGHHLDGVSFEICYDSLDLAQKMCFPGTLEQIDECNGVCAYARGIVRMDVTFCGNCGGEPEAEWWDKHDGLDLDEVNRVLEHDVEDVIDYYYSPAPAPTPEYEDDWEGDDDDSVTVGDDDDAVGDDDDSVGDDDDSVGDDDDSVGDDDDSVGDDDDSVGDDDDTIPGNDGDDEGDDGFGDD
eukprot:scaffold113_cov339-Pavlova_lutheri.AAC.31